MRNIFVLNSPIQYLLARTISENFFKDDENIVLQYLDSGDFGLAFDEIDDLIGSGRMGPRYRYGQAGAVNLEIPFSRIFFSNRFNSTENKILVRMRPFATKVCAFEDGLALYLGHHFLDPRIRDGNWQIPLKNALKWPLVKLGLVSLASIQRFFPFRLFDEVYSVFPDVPGVRADARKISIADAFRKICRTTTERSSKSCVILSQSLVVDGLVDDASYRTFLHSRMKELRESYSRIFYKPHPRDPSEYGAILKTEGAELLPERFARVPVELFLAAHPGIHIYGFWSTTLIYASIFDARSFSFGASLVAQAQSNKKLKRAWRQHQPVLARFDVLDYQPPNEATY